MTSPCPPSEQWDLLADRQLGEDEAQALREHARTCDRCGNALKDSEALIARIAAPFGGTAGEASVAEVMRRVRMREAPRARPPRPRWAQAGLVLGALAASLLLVLVAPRMLAGDESADWTPRGAGSPSALSQRVGIRFHRATNPPTPLDAGARLPLTTPLVVAYRNIESARPVYLLAFAVDASGEVHWLYPGHLSETSDEPAPRLETTGPQERMMPEAVQLEAPAAGPLQLVSIVSPEPLRVSSVERLAPGQRTLAALRERWPAAVVEALEVELARDAK
ncbi:DUF4384 domain-containing protein [Archangium lipolyticum]|uniref:DUF4384 domain-containing protein n=1 Tax=Archangium lipolyticum TaxID=2970465 RepID=UPI00214A66A1|nr:DUF4384 domain-containing protein [Archangium lipolyticum]